LASDLGQGRIVPGCRLDGREAATDSGRYITGHMMVIDAGPTMVAVGGQHISPTG
jgi:hypothetical protein